MTPDQVLIAIGYVLLLMTLAISGARTITWLDDRRRQREARTRHRRLLDEKRD